ncbi:Peptide hydrolase [Mycena venus]|uniref:Peptide hydrolase n=1 Tax=Mycena venus TaxID=2733690 RepID=A0A8H6WX92_9AGAR|nr:Peptide hydrolase [Mycena venus]
MQMLSFVFNSLTLAAFAAAQSGQTPLNSHLEGWQFEHYDNVPGLDRNLDELRLVQFSLDSEPEWMTERERFQAKAIGRNFMDITDTPLLGTLSQKPNFSYPSPNSTIVSKVFSYLSTAEPKANLEHFTSYHNRYYDSDLGKASSDWLFAKILLYTAELASEEQRPLITVESLKHPWKQNSIVIRISPLDAVDSDPTTILGAHIDSVNHKDPVFGKAPGAGDDGSGTVAILEAYRALLVAGYVPISPIEFHFYAGEEGGRRGSQAIASSFENAGKAVRGMMQFDMTAFHKSGTREEIAVLTNGDTADASLTEFLISVIERYLDIPWVKDAYPDYASSDDESWRKAGYQTCHPLEGQFKNTNPYVHTPDDRIDISPEFSFDHMLHFSKLAVAFAIEMSSY